MRRRRLDQIVADDDALEDALGNLLSLQPPAEPAEVVPSEGDMDDALADLQLQYKSASDDAAAARPRPQTEDEMEGLLSDMITEGAQKGKTSGAPKRNREAAAIHAGLTKALKAAKTKLEQSEKSRKIEHKALNLQTFRHQDLWGPKKPGVGGHGHQTWHAQGFLHASLSTVKPHAFAQCFPVAHESVTASRSSALCRSKTFSQKCSKEFFRGSFSVAGGVQFLRVRIPNVLNQTFSKLN